MSFLIPGQTNRAAIRWQLAHSSGWDRECKALKTVWRSGEGTNGRGVPVLMSQTMLVEEAGRGRDLRWREIDVECCRALSSASFP